MTEKRRLQLEMEKCFKKIDEQLALFDGMLESVLQMDKNPAPTPHHESHREKMQDELKREIKKTRIRKIKDEIDRTESKLEALDEKGGKRGKREAEREESELKRHLERATFHVTNLEVCMRLITNEKLESAVVMALLKEPLDMYVEALEPENEYDLATLHSLEPDDVYVELKLGDFISLLNAGPPVEESGPPPPAVEKPPSKPAATKRVAVAAPVVLPPALPKPRVPPPVRPVVAAVRGPSWAAVAAVKKVVEVAKPPAAASSAQRSPPTEAEKKLESCSPPPVLLLVKAKELEKTPLRSCVRLPRRRRRRRVHAFTQTDGRAPSPVPAALEPTAEMIAFLRAANADAVQRGYSVDFFAFRPPFRLPTRDRHTQTWPQAPPLRLPPGWMPDTLEHYEKLDAGTLFYYFRNLTFHSCHLLVVRALQSKGWRLHSRLGSWFLRAGKPLEMGDGFERAPFHTFCFKEWDVKKIDDFRFDYECIDTYY
ncbi:hypothetical protein M3Y99_01812100 [Aphelenchoides fujianensis]|nr:hypothetical protein M3Y99_01812100 [Aphelenchoides fujianensis]